MTGRRTSTAVVVAAALVASTIGLVVGSPSPALAAPPPAVGTVAIYAGAGFTPQGIALGSDGNLWFANYGSDGIGRITTAGVVTSFPGGGAISAPRSSAPTPRRGRRASPARWRSPRPARCQRAPRRC